MCASAMGAKLIIGLIKLIVREKEILRCYCIGNKTPLVVEKVFFFFFNDPMVRWKLFDFIV